MDALAARGNPRAVRFHFGQIKLRPHREGVSFPNKKAPAVTAGPAFNFSFSGIKTAVLRYVETHHMRERIEARRAALAAATTLKPGSQAVGALCGAQALGLLAAFQCAAAWNPLRQTLPAAESARAARSC